ncbi:MAG: PilT/PilU family type 4a pilus ATPase [Oscillospiraceae bacterium]
MKLITLLQKAVQSGASDIFIIAGRPIALNINYTLLDVDEEKLMPADTEELIKEIYANAPGRSVENMSVIGSEDFSLTIRGLSRFRVSAYMQRGSYAAVVRVISFEMPDPIQLGIPEKIMGLTEKKKGMVLVTGSAGSGKSTTLACMIDRINSTQSKHIITLEDPLEYIHNHKKSIVTQREIGTDARDYLSAIKASLRQRPDVILLGEMRDIETISVALTAAETGHMIFSTLHTMGAASTIDRILDAFPPDQRHQVATQLSMILEAVVSQQLLPAKVGTVVLATELMMMNSAIRNIIRENKIHQLDNVIYSAQDSDMISMDTSILKLYKDGKITEKTAVQYAINQDMMKKKLAIE